MPDDITTPQAVLPPPTGIGNISLDSVVSEGVTRGASTFQIADAIKTWRTDATEFGKQQAADTNPEGYWKGTARMDADVNDVLTSLRLGEINNRINALGYTNPDDKRNFLERLDSANGNPNSTALSDLPAPSGATEKLVAADIQKLAAHPAFTMETNLTYGNSIDVGGSTLARFSLRDSGKGKVDALVTFDRPDLQREIDELVLHREQQPEGVGADYVAGIDKAIAAKKAEMDKSVQVVTLPEVDVPARIKEHEAKLEQARKDVETYRSQLASASESPHEAAAGAAIGASESLKYAGQEVAAEEAIVAGLKSKGARTFALNLDLQEELKKPQYEAKMGDKNLWGDFVSGAKSASISSRIAVERAGQIVGMSDDGDMAKLREGLSNLQTSDAGSTQRAFTGGVLNKTTQGAANSLGSMSVTVLPTGALSRLATGAMEKMLAKGAVGELGEAASASTMMPMSYGSEYARMLDQADSLQKTDPELANKLRAKADIAALMQASIDFGTELIGGGHNPFLERAGFASFVRKYPGNVAKEGVEEVAAGGLERGVKQPITQDGTAQANEPVTKGMFTEFTTGAAAAVPMVATGALSTGSQPTAAPESPRSAEAPPAPKAGDVEGETSAIPSPPPGPTPESYSQPPPPEPGAAAPTPEQTAQTEKDVAILRDSAAHGLLLLGGVGPEATPEKITSNALALMQGTKESADSLAAQVDMMVDPAKPKTAVFIDEGTPAVQEPIMAAVEAAKVKHNVEGDYGLVKAEGGMVLFDKAAHPDEAIVVQMANSGTLGQALGYGVASKPDVVSEETRAKLVAEEAAGLTGTDLQQRALAALTILLQSPGAVEKAAVVTDGTPEEVKKVKEALQKLASPADIIVEVPAAQMPEVIAKREQHKGDLEAALKRKQGAQTRERPRETTAFTDNPTILELISSHGGLMSRSNAQRGGMSKEQFAKNKSEWDDAPQLAHPTHNVIYTPRGQLPTTMAAAMGFPDVQSMWAAIKSASVTALQIAEQERTVNAQEKDLVQNEKQFAADVLTPSETKEGYYPGDGQVGDTFTVNGEKITVTDISDDGYVTLTSKKWGVHKIELGQQVFTDPVQATGEFLPPEDQEKPAKTKPKQTDMFAGTKEDPFNLIAETPEERAARQAEEDRQRKRQEAEEIARAKEAAERNQTTMPFDAAEPVQRGNANAWERAKNGDEKAFDELDKQKRAKLGEPPKGKAGQDAPQRFFSADAFERFFERTFAALNFNAFLEAIKASDRAIYTPLLKKLFAAEKAGDAVAAAKAEWFRHVFAGTTPPNAKAPAAAEPPPPAAAKPAGTTSTPPPPPKAKAAAPPPPPPPPKPPATPKTASFNIPALVKLSKALGSIPRINLRMRRFIRGSFSPRTGAVNLNKNIFQDPAQAAKTLAHEIGHFIDMIGQGLQSNYLTQKIAPLGDWKNIFGPLWAWAKLNPSARGGYNFGPIEEILKDEAVALSKEWRGDFDEKTNRYRASGNELYADFLSALMNDPTWTATIAPNLSWFFTNALSQKPAVMAAWTHLQDLLKGDALMTELAKEREASSEAAVKAMIEGDFDSKYKKAEQEFSLNRFFKWLHGEFANAAGPMVNKASNADKQGIGKLLSKIGLGYTVRWFDEMRRRVGAQFGVDFSTQTEESLQFARSRKAWVSDKLTALVYRPLMAAGIPAQMLGDYMMHNRIINDSTATADAYNADPNLFRQFLKWLVNEAGLKDTTATTGRGGSAFDFTDAGIDSIPASELMDRAAAMFRFINEQTDATLWDKINRAAQSKKAPPFAGKAMLMFNVSAYQANPQGFTPQDSRDELARMEKNMGADRFDILKQSAEAFYDVSSEIMHEANDLGMFKPSHWSEIIEPNLRSYSPWAVLDYFTGHLSASASQKKNGTFKEILRPDQAYQLKLGSLIHRMQRQKIANVMREFFTRVGKEFGFSGEMTIMDDLTDQKKADLEKRGYGVSGFWDKGVYRYLVFEDGKMLAYMEKYNPDDVSPLMDLAHENYGFWYKVVIAYAPSFQVGNLGRQVRTSGIEIGYKRALRLLWDYTSGLSYPLRQTVMRFARRDPSYNLPTANLAIAYAKAVAGEEWTPEIEELVSRGVLPPPESIQLGSMTPQEFMEATTSGLISMLAIGSPAQATLTDGLTYKARHSIPVASRMINATLNGLSWASSIVESGAKIARFNALEAKNAKLRAEKFAAGGKVVANPKEEFSPQFVNAISRLSGIPNPGVTPRGTSMLDAVFMFARVHLQGLRRQRTLLFNPRTRGGFALRATLDVLPLKLLTAMAATGAIDALIRELAGGDDEDKKKKPWVDWQEWAKRASPYKIEKDDELFIGWISDKDDGPLADSAISGVPFFGQIAKRWHPPHGHEEIPKEWTPFTLRLPFSEEGRLTAPTTFQLANTMLDSPLAVDPEKRATWAAKFAADSILPSLNPTWKYVGYASQISSDEPPMDTYRNRPIADPSQWAVGDDLLGFGSDDLMGLGTYLNRAELIGLDLAAAAGIPGLKETHKNENLPDALLAIQQTPGLSRLVALDNYQGVREYKEVAGDNKRIAQRADLLKGKETEKAVSRMTFLQNMGDPKKTTLAGEKTGRDAGQEAEYKTLRQWYNKYYQGTDKDPGLYDVMKKYAQAKEEKNQTYIQKLEPEAKQAANMLEEKALEALKFATDARHNEELPKRAERTTAGERAKFGAEFPEAKRVLPAPPPAKQRRKASSGIRVF